MPRLNEVWNVSPVSLTVSFKATPLRVTLLIADGQIPVPSLEEAG